MRYRIQVVEEVAGDRGPTRFRARPDLNGAVDGDCFSTAKRVARKGLADDPRFQGLTVISMGFRDKVTLHVVVRSSHLNATRGIPGRVYKAPA